MDIFDQVNAGQFAAPLREACQRWGITNGQDQACFLAQVSVESAGFTRTSESLAYRAPRLLAIFKGRNGLETIEQAETIVAGGADAIAEAIYGGSWGASHLGNTQAGDGAKYPGHGLIQLTGKDNHHRASIGCYGDDRFVSTPELLTLAKDAARSAAWFWYSKSLNGIRDVEVITKRINGGLNGLDERQALTDQFLKLV